MFGELKNSPYICNIKINIKQNKMKKLLLLLLLGGLLVMISCTKDELVETPASLSSITIGTQVWTAKNLDVTTYRDGTPIPQVTDPKEWENLTTGAWCYYENNKDNNQQFGKLYNWYAVNGVHDNDSNTPNKILAPNGWHVPNISEWDILFNHLSSSNDDKRVDKLKDVNGFNNKASGSRYVDGSFHVIEMFDSVPFYIATTFWLQDRFEGYGTCVTILDKYLDKPYSFTLLGWSLDVRSGASVRCVKD
jgi:uncharacterized protein (TIGR02145 family)